MITLTKRENEVLELMAQGISDNEIAKKLSIRQTTLQTHIKGIFNKLGLIREFDGSHVMRVRAVLWFLKKEGKL